MEAEIMLIGIYAGLELLWLNVIRKRKTEIKDNREENKRHNTF